MILFVGLQASGKSRFYRARFAGTHVLVSKDTFRNNRRPQRRQMHLIEEALASGRSVVVDNTNPTVGDRAPIIAMARLHGAAVIGYHFVARIADCLARNRLREGKECVPDRAIYIARSRMRPPTYAEGFDRLYTVRIAQEVGFVVRVVRTG